MDYSIVLPTGAEMLYNNTYTLNNSVFFDFTVKITSETSVGVYVKTERAIFGDKIVFVRNATTYVSTFETGKGYLVGFLTGKDTIFYVRGGVKFIEQE